MDDQSRDDLLDRLLGEFSDLLAAGKAPEESEYLARVDPSERDALARCLRLVRGGMLTVPPSAVLAEGARLSAYRVVREIARGGMSIVYLAEQLDLRREVALKVLRPALAVDARNVERFEREARAVSRLRHPNLVGVHAVGNEASVHWLAMEYVAGPSLADVIARLHEGARRAPRQGPTVGDLARACCAPAVAGSRRFEAALCALLAPVAQALHHAHENGLLHRDVKPSNILVRADGQAVIADFGLAKGDGDPGLSITGVPVGTPYYMSPEQASAARQVVDRRTDVYSLGVTLFEALSGVRPFQGGSVLEVLDAIANHPAPSLASLAPWCRRDVVDVVARAMAFDREQRYASCAELAEDLERAARGEPCQASRARGGQARRARAAVARLARGDGLEFRSSRSFLGLPLVEVCFPPRHRRGGRRAARAWIAVGNAAVGALAIGNFAAGAISIGGMSAGCILSLGGMAAGGLACGGLALGGLALGGVAVGYGAMGGVSVGLYAMGGKAIGRFVLDGLRRDPQAMAWFEAAAAWLPGVRWMLRLGRVDSGRAP